MWKSKSLVQLRNLSTITSEKCVKKAAEIKIPVPWGHVSGKWWGRADIQPLLGLHGWQDNAGTFDELAPLLPDNVSLFAVDHPGHGLSSWFPSSTHYNSLQGLLALRRIVKHFNWDRVSIIGHSMGSELGFLYSSVYPEETELLIGLDLAKPVAINPQYMAKKAESIIDKTLKMHDISQENCPKYTHSELVERLYQGYKGSLTKNCCEILLRRGKMKFPCGRYYYTRDPRLNSSTGLLSEYSQRYLLQLAENVKCKVLNIKGKPGKDFENAKYYHEALNVMKKSASAFEFHEVEGTHHFHLSNPVPTAGIITKFLSHN